MSARERAFSNRVVNPVMIVLITHGLGPPICAVVETTGHKTGRKRLVPVASGLDGDTFWMISGRGEKASYVHNIRANPRVRVIAPGQAARRAMHPFADWHRSPDARRRRACPPPPANCP